MSNPDPMSEEQVARGLPDDPAAVARSYLDAFATADPDVIASHVSEDFSNEHTAALGSGCRGRDAYRERLPGFLANMAGLRYSIDHLVADGASVAVFYTMTARWQGTTPIEVQGAQRLEIVDGSIIRRVDTGTARSSSISSPVDGATLRTQTASAASKASA